MTKEDLEKEAIAKYKIGSYPRLHPDHYAFIHGYLAGAEPREERIEELDKENGKLEGKLADLQSEYIELENFHNNEVNGLKAQIEELKKENAELRKVAEFQQSNNMNRHFENKKLKECLTVGTTWNKALNSMNKALEEERDKYRNMVFDKGEQLSKAKEIIKELIEDLDIIDGEQTKELKAIKEAEQFLKEAE